MKKDNDLRVGSVKKWHAWQDPEGIRYTPSLYQKSVVYAPQGDKTVTNVQEMKEAVAGLFCFVNDILDSNDITFVNELLGHCIPYLSKSGIISALRVKHKRRVGFLISTSTWKWYSEANQDLLDYVTLLFKVFGYQSTTPASLSEKVLRSTLPEKISIYRPSKVLRRDILDNHRGGRIDKAIDPAYYNFAEEYDKNKAYLAMSRLTMSPYESPMYIYHPSLDEYFSYPCAFGEVSLIAHDSVLNPIQVNGTAPVEGECIDMWLWTDELRDCIEAGYTVTRIHRCWTWRYMSNWMEEWSDILYSKYEQAKNEPPWFCEIIKTMAVGLPGRFLHSPEYYTLIPASEAIEGVDTPLLMNWHNHGDRMFSDYAIHPVYDAESTALCAVGSYIVMAMRHELYQRMLKEIKAGAKLLGSYIDNFKIDRHTIDDTLVGSGLGQYKRIDLKDVYVESNRMIATKVDPFGWEEDIMKAPGFDNERRILFWQRYRKMRDNLTS